MCTRFENGVQHNGQQLGRAVNSFSEFVAIKTLSSCRGLRCYNHQFHAVFVLSLLNKSGRIEERKKRITTDNRDRHNRD